MCWFAFSLFFLQATHIITNNDEWEKKLQVTQSKLSSLIHERGTVKAVDNTTSRFYQRKPWQNFQIPRPLLLNERIRNPKFISKHPKRKKTSQREKSITLNKTKTLKNKKPVTSEPYANILNTNFKYVFLARMKNKDAVVKNKNAPTVPAKNMNDTHSNFASPLDVRLGLERERTNRIFRRRKKKNHQQPV